MLTTRQLFRLLFVLVTALLIPMTAVVGVISFDLNLIYVAIFETLVAFTALIFVRFPLKSIHISDDSIVINSRDRVIKSYPLSSIESIRSKSFFGFAPALKLVYSNGEKVSISLWLKGYERVLMELEKIETKDRLELIKSNTLILACERVDTTLDRLYTVILIGFWPAVLISSFVISGTATIMLYWVIFAWSLFIISWLLIKNNNHLMLAVDHVGVKYVESWVYWLALFTLWVLLRVGIVFKSYAV